MITHLKLSPNVKQFPAVTPYLILCLSGGGYRGLFTAEVLALLLDTTAGAEDTNKAFFIRWYIGRRIAGSWFSARAFTALLRDALLDHGPRIFDDRVRILGRTLPIRKFRGMYGALLTAKYKPDALFSAISSILGDQKEIRLKDIDKHLILTATCAVTKSPLIFSNVPPLGLDADVRLIDALIASTAAPGYFPPFQLANGTLLDGGLVANAPDLVAILEAVAKRRAKLEDCCVISIGTAKTNPASIPRTVGSRGIIRSAPDLFDITSNAQEVLAVRQAKILLSDRYLRIDASPSPQQSKAVDLDRVFEQATSTLRFLARAVVDDLETVLQNVVRPRPSSDL